ncbi:MAG: hypothetical protein FD141_795 [Fusobacteria bacterium]|nr:MAG: hypothetical protein FD141_795 [Fusobacteriota bacterium]KAF0228539.1 MAG: hypothetical protein FD182_795 [Fusobacteriota bacterium]
MKEITLTEVKEFLDVKGIILENETEYLRKQNFFNTCKAITKDKLKNLELMTANETMIDLITNQRPDLEYIHHHTQLLAIQYEYFEKLTETRGKLTEEEKLKLAFANFATIYIVTYDRNTGKPRSILDDFKTVEKFEKLYNDYKGRSQIMFAFLNEIKEDEGYGILH